MAESRRVSKLCSVAGVAFLALTGSAFAGGSLKDEPKAEREFTYSFTLTGTSDYVFRGVSQSDNDPTIQGSFGIGYGIFYAGIWATGIDWTSDKDANIETDFYAGIKPTWGKATFDFGVIYYDYPGASNG
ncbi:MAG TPA: TorF family putative porin, partial [Hyphomicrobium sp.]|nr:TorF family putative porin [Hyphomicrobium sp.]